MFIPPQDVHANVLRSNSPERSTVDGKVSERMVKLIELEFWKQWNIENNVT